MTEHATSDPRLIRAGLRISVVSLLWTLAVGGSSLLIGILDRALAVAAFGAISLLDAIGSTALTVHFRASLHRSNPSHRLEHITLLLIAIGLAATGSATIALSAVRLAVHSESGNPSAVLVPTAGSILALGVLAARKRSIAVRIPSAALRADATVSGVGAVLATVSLADVALRASGTLWWADPAAAIVVGLVAVGLSARTLRAAI